MDAALERITFLAAHHPALQAAVLIECAVIAPATGAAVPPPPTPLLQIVLGALVWRPTQPGVPVSAFDDGVVVSELGVDGPVAERVFVNLEANLKRQFAEERRLCLRVRADLIVRRWSQ